MTGGAATAGADQVGHQHREGLGVLLPNQDEFNARRGISTRASWTRASSIMRRHGRRPDPQEQAVLLRRRGSATASATAASTPYTVPTAKMRNGDFSEVLALNPNFQIYDPATGTPTAADRTFFDGRGDSGRSHQQHRAEDPGALPGAEQPGHEQRPAEQPVPRRVSPKADRDNYDVKVNWNRTAVAPDLGASSR